MNILKRIVCLLLALTCCLGVVAVTAPTALAADYAPTKPLPALTGNKAQDAANIAISQLGYQEGYNNANAYGAWWKQETGSSYDFVHAGWCSMFALWCANQAGLKTGVGYGNSAVVGQCMTWFRNNASADSSFSVAPQPGDFIFFGRPGSYEHVAIVTAYDKATNKVTFVGGNQGDKVTSFTMEYTSTARYGYQVILGIGRPNYGGSPIVTPGCSCDDGFAGYYTCITQKDPLNIRSGHGTGYSVVGTIPPGAKVHVTKAQGLSDNSWAHVEYNGVKGYCAMQYLKRMASCSDGSHTDSDGDSWCDACGQDLHFTLQGANLKLGDSLTMYFYIPTAELRGNDYYVKMIRYYSDDPNGRYGDDPNHPVSQEITIAYEDWETYDAAGTLLRVPYYGLAAKEMIDEIHVTVYNGKGVAVSDTWVDSVERYCLRMAGNTSQSASVRSVCVALLNYGAEAQKFFGYSQAAQTLANRSIGDYQYLAPSQTSPANQLVPCDGYVGTTLDLESEIVMKVYFRNLSRDMYATYSYTDHYGKQKTGRVNGQAFYERDAANKIYGVPITGMSMGDYNQVVTVKVYHADSTQLYSMQDSMGSYLRRQMDKSSDSIYSVMADAMGAAYQYLHS